MQKILVLLSLLFLTKSFAGDGFIYYDGSYPFTIGLIYQRGFLAIRNGYNFDFSNAQNKNDSTFTWKNSDKSGSIDLGIGLTLKNEYFDAEVSPTYTFHYHINETNYIENNNLQTYEDWFNKFGLNIFIVKLISNRFRLGAGINVFSYEMYEDSHYDIYVQKTLRNYRDNFTMGVAPYLHLGMRVF